jgi:hypothetical protein
MDNKLRQNLSDGAVEWASNFSWDKTAADFYKSKGRRQESEKMKNTTRQILEFDTVLAIFESYMKTTAAKKRLEEIDLYRDLDALTREYDISRLMTDFVKFDSNLHFEPVGDVSEILEKSKISGNVLEIEELLGFKTLLDVYIGNKKTFEERKDKYADLPGIFCPTKSLPGSTRRLRRRSKRTAAFPTTRRTNSNRSAKRRVSLRAHIHEKLNAYMTRADSDEIVQERLITVRDGRYVIPIRAGYKNRESFIVHAYSKTGETVFAEPQFAVQANNELTELDELEAAEIYRILKALTVSISENYEILAAIHEAVGVMEFHYAKSPVRERIRLFLSKTCGGHCDDEAQGRASSASALQKDRRGAHTHRDWRRLPGSRHFRTQRRRKDRRAQDRRASRAYGALRLAYSGRSPVTGRRFRIRIRGDRRRTEHRRRTIDLFGSYRSFERDPQVMQ